MGLWDAIGSAGDWLGDKIQSGSEYLQDTVDGWTDGVSGDGKAIDAITDQNDGGLMSSYLQDDNGEFGPQNKIDGFSEVNETNQIEPVIGETEEVGETNADGTPETEFNPSINKAVGEGSLMDAGGHMQNDPAEEEWHTDVDNQFEAENKADLKNTYGTTNLDKIKKTNQSAAENSAGDVNLERDKMQEFGSKISEMGAQMAKNPYEYKPWK